MLPHVPSLQPAAAIRARLPSRRAIRSSLPEPMNVSPPIRDCASRCQACEPRSLMGTQGSPCARFQLAIRSDNLPLIHAAASDVGWVPLRDALGIVLGIDAKAEERF